MEKELEQTLQVEIMEPYLFLAEMKPKAKDPAKHMEEMRECWDKLKAFIRKVETRAMEEGWWKGSQIGDEEVRAEARLQRTNEVVEMINVLKMKNKETEKWSDDYGIALTDLSAKLKETN